MACPGIRLMPSPRRRRHPDSPQTRPPRQFGIDFGCLPLALVQAAVGGYQRQQAGEITAGAQRVPIQEMSQLGGVGDYHLARPEQLLGFSPYFQVDIMGVR